MTEKDFEQLKAGDMVVYKGNSPLGEDFTRGEQYTVAGNSECHSIIGIFDDNGTPRFFRCAQAPDVFCSEKEWTEKWESVLNRKKKPATNADALIAEQLEKYNQIQ